MSAPRLLRHARTLGLLAGGALLLAACSFGTPEPVTKQAKEMHTLYLVVLAIGALVFVGVEVAVVFVVIRYRGAKGDDSLPRQVHGNKTVEIVWTTIPAIIVLSLFFLSWRTINKVNAEEKHPPLRITVEGFQWQWRFIYPGGLEVVGSTEKPPTLVLPVEETVNLQLRSKDVNHAFYVPAFLFKEDLVPGRRNSFDVFLEKKGTFRGQCAEFCGLQHARMAFDVRAVSRAEYDDWYKQARQASAKAAACVPKGTEVALEAKDVKFDKDCIAAPADTPWEIEFKNADKNIDHNVAIYDSDKLAKTLFKGKLFKGVATETYEVAAMPAGAYYFQCDVHPGMKGVVQIGEPSGGGAPGSG